MSILIDTPPATVVEAPEIAVAREAARLDRLFPGWEDRVDTATLELPSTRDCVLAQIGGRQHGAFGSLLTMVIEDGYRGDATYASNRYRDDWIFEIERRRL